PARELWKAREGLALPLGKPDPADTSHVPDRVATGENLLILQARIHHAVEPVEFVAATLKRVGHLLRRVAPEVIGLARLRPEIGHLPEQPFVDRDPPAFACRIEPPGFAAEVLQDRP